MRRLKAQGSRLKAQAIVEYLLLGVAVTLAIALVVDAARAKATMVTQREIDRINAMPSH